MMRQAQVRRLFILLIVGGCFIILPYTLSAPASQLQDTAGWATSTARRRVNAPYDVPGHEAAVFWFGQVTQSENYADVRVGYRENLLFVHLNIMDRLLWYDLSPSATDLIAWDSATLYLSTEGNVGDVLNANAYRFDAQLVREQNHPAYQAGYRGNESGWISTTLPFTTTSSWSGNVPNDDISDRGWSLIYYIPFTSLDQEAPPDPGTVWGLALALHDRDSASGSPLADQVWPEAMVSERPSSWGELSFGAWPTYQSPPAIPVSTLTLRHGLNGVTVVDADVGGSSTCGALAAPGEFLDWGELNYAGKEFLNIQNVGSISEWPCFSKYYVTFPLEALPSDAVILTATLTLYQFGNAGAEKDPPPSYIQVLTIDEDWDESLLTWNNAPLAVENVSVSWVDPLDEPPDWPGIPREWDVSYATSEAHAAGESLRLAMYSPDWDFHSGKYFWSSDVGASGEGRPTLTINWGYPDVQLEKWADKAAADDGEAVSYVLSVRGSGLTLTLTDTLPSAMLWTDGIMVSGTGILPVYDSGQHQLTWEDDPAVGEQVLITYTVSVNTTNRESLVNIGELVDPEGHTSSATSIVIANPFRCYLPLLLKS